MFDIALYRIKLEFIRQKLFLSKGDLAEKIGISSSTLARLFDDDNTIPQSNRTIRAVMKFVKKYKTIADKVTVAGKE